MMIATLHMRAFLADQFWAVVGVIFSFELKQTVTTFLQAIQLYSVQFNYYNNRNRPRLSNRRNSFHKKKVILLPQDWLLGQQRIDRHFILSAVGGVKIVSPISTFVLNTLILKLIKGIFLDTNGFYDVMCKGSVLLTGGMKLNSQKKKKKQGNKDFKYFLQYDSFPPGPCIFLFFLLLVFFFFFFLVGYYRQTIHTGYQIQHSRLWIRTLVLSSRFG